MKPVRAGTTGGKRSGRPIVAAGLLVTLLAALLYLFPPGLIGYLDGKVFDTFLRLGFNRETSGKVVLVAIDDATLAKYGQWPWPRHLIAELLEKLNSYGPKVSALDFTFAEPDRTSLSLVKDEAEWSMGVKISLPDLPPELLDNDLRLSRALSKGPYVLGNQFTFGAENANGKECILHPLSALKLGGEEHHRLFTADGVVCNIPILTREVKSSGFLNVSPDSDGILRRVPLIIAYRDHLYPSLALAAAMQAKGASMIEITAGPAGVDFVKFDNMRIPVDARGQMLINHRGKRNTFPTVSAALVMEGKAPPEKLAGKLVIVGSNAHGIIDVRSTPLDPVVAGTEIQATVADNLINGDPLYSPPWSRAMGLFLVIGAGLFSIWICLRDLPLWSLGFMALATAGVNAASAGWLWSSNLFISPVLPSASLWTTFTALIAMRTFIAELTVKERNKKLLVTQDALIQSMASMVEKRHIGTGGHIQRTRHYVRLLAQKLKTHPAFSHVLDDVMVELLFRLAPMHDIGKVGVPDRVLTKRAALTPEEFEEMKRHTLYGAETIEEAQAIIGEESFLSIAHDFALTHQEKWDGSGYPKGLKGMEIPLAGRLMAVADVYDALVSERDYKPGIPHEKAVEIISAGRGNHFDPDIVDAFMEISEDFKVISEAYSK